MNEGYKNWILERARPKDPAVLVNFLRRVKFDPDGLLPDLGNFIVGNQMVYAVEANRPVSIDILNDPKELLQALQQHFAKELAEITQ